MTKWSSTSTSNAVKRKTKIHGEENMFIKGNNASAIVAAHPLVFRRTLIPRSEDKPTSEETLLKQPGLTKLKAVVE